ncbi:hypothetical protein AB0D49_26210 [Streptomyces sp. NPDC048290]|uniref:hypothetical protein n=1 Tax=Streptomyces sp. NPDC048290 TaxID=3155811 RepID=UPI003448A22D
MRRLRPEAAVLAGLLLSLPLPFVASAATPAGSVKSAVVQAGPGAEGPDLSQANRTTAPAGLPDWSRAGFRGGMKPPGDEAVTDDAACRITPDRLASTYQVVPDDGADDTTGLQKAIDDIKSRCSPQAGFYRLSLISLPSGRIDVTRQIYVDADYLILRGQGSGDGGTRLVFRPDVNTRYDTVVNGRWDQDSMTAGTGSDTGTGGWMWPGRGMLRVQTRDLAERYRDDHAAAPANRKDIFEGSVNQHWASGIKLAARPGDPGFSARQGSSVVQLVATANMSKFSSGGYVWVGAANSTKFYAQQGVTDRRQMENLHMRQQMFRVTGIDATARQITLDRPLEWDLPVDSVSDGSDPLGDTPYPSKVTPLKVVEGVGFEDFAFTQDLDGLPKLGGGTYELTPQQAVNNYGNLAPEYAMHGIVYKWAANSWARGLKGTMTGSHPVVTENARNLQIERNSFDGAWNKGKGGNGYLRGSRVWDSLWAYNHSRNLRHFTFQWSASGNVAFRNDLDSDLNLHGGWERYNLFEQNTVRIPYEHRSANCQANCGGEGGESDPGTWYPIWWAAGPKAAKWAGSSGPQNVFFNNTLIKQTTPGGPFEPYAPYSAGSQGAGAGTVFQFGSDNGAPHRFRALAQGGQDIADWTGSETADFRGQGVVTRTEGRRSSLFLRNTGGGLEPRDDDERKVITWNMQGSSSASNENKYSMGLIPLMQQTGASVALLQEAGAPPGGAVHLRDIPQNRLIQWDGSYPPVREFRIAGTASRPLLYLYWIHSDFNPQNIGRVNLAIATRTRVQPQDVFVTDRGISTGIDGRPALGVNVDGVAYFTVHGLSGSGNDVPGLMRNIRTMMAEATGPDQPPLPWISLGDNNREPGSLSDALGSGFQVHATHVHTHPTRMRQSASDDMTERVLDYAVTPTGPGAAPTVISQARVDTMLMSDHFPVEFTLGGVTPAPPLGGIDQDVGDMTLLRNAATTNIAGPSRSSGSSSHVVTDQPVDADNPQSQTFHLAADPEYPGYYRLIYQDAPFRGHYLGQEGGARDGRIVLWPRSEQDQLWRPAGHGDGTWTLENRVTGQVLTALGNGQALTARDHDGSAGQRWFLGDPRTMANSNELHLVEFTSPALALEANTSAAHTSVVLRPDSDRPEQRFTMVPVKLRGDEPCYYLTQGGRYVNSTADHPQETRDESAVTLDPFRSYDDGYVWCVSRVPGEDTRYVYLSNRTASGQRLSLQPRPQSAELMVRAWTPDTPVWHAERIY